MNKQDSLTQTLRRKPMYQCPLCPLNYHLSTNLIRHVENAHSKTPTVFTIKCSKCPKTFSEKRNLDKHMKRHEQHQAVCSSCKEHFECSRNEMMRSFKCHNCENAYTNRDSLIRHFRHCHKESELLNSVPVLGSSCPDLKATLPKSFSCTLCSKAFNSFQSLQNHLRCFHRLTNRALQSILPSYPAVQSLVPSPDTAVQPLPVKSDTVSSRFRCKHCPKAYTALSNLRRHQRSKNHEDFRNFQPMVAIPHQVILKECRVVLHKLPDALINKSSNKKNERDPEGEDWNLIWNPDSSSDEDYVCTLMLTSEHAMLSERDPTNVPSSTSQQCGELLIEEDPAPALTSDQRHHFIEKKEFKDDLFDDLSSSDIDLNFESDGEPPSDLDEVGKLWN